jgi:hypothetical protein
VVELPSPWLVTLTCCGGCIGLVWAVLCIGDGENCVVVNRLKSLFCGLGCIHIALHPPVAHTCPMPSLNRTGKPKYYNDSVGETIKPVEFDLMMKNCNEIKGLSKLCN